MMLSKAPQVKTMGDHTAGSSGNPRQLDAGAGITVTLPRWNDLDAEGNPIDAVGVPAEIPVKTVAADFDELRDPVLEAALVRLRMIEKLEGSALKLRSGATAPAERPHVVSVSPQNRATDINPNTEIRIRFDRPMDPQTYGVTFHNADPKSKQESGFRRTGLTRYDAERNEFIFPVSLTPEAGHHLQIFTEDRLHPESAFRFFRSMDGVATSAFEWKFQTAVLSPEDADVTLTAKAGELQLKDEENRAKTLLTLIGQIRQRRRELKSVIERVDDRTDWSKQSNWSTKLKPDNHGRFWWQGNARFRAEGDSFFFNGKPLRVGGNEKQCWSLISDHFVIGPSESILKQHVHIADAFLAESEWTDERLIREWQLDYLGDEQYQGRNCHRIRSRREITYSKEPLFRTNHRDWLIDAKISLPIVCEDFGNVPRRFEFTSEKIDEELPDEVFQPPKVDGIVPRELEPVDDKYDHHFLNAFDGSSGNISIRWGKRGPGGTYSSGMN